jgi:hypothetical protein
MVDEKVVGIDMSVEKVSGEKVQVWRSARRGNVE